MNDIRECSKTPLGRGRVFVRVALNEGAAMDYLKALVWNRELAKYGFLIFFFFDFMFFFGGRGGGTKAPKECCIDLGYYSAFLLAEFFYIFFI